MTMMMMMTTRQNNIGIVKLAKTGHGPHYSQLVVICVLLLLFVFSVLFVSYVLCVNTIAVDKYIVSFIIIRETTELTVSTVIKCYTETVMLKLSNLSLIHDVTCC